MSSYTVPGPAVYSGGKTKKAGSDCTGCESTCKVGSGPSPTLSSSPQPTGGNGGGGGGGGGCSVAEYGQCGGNGYTGKFPRHEYEMQSVIADFEQAAPAVPPDSSASLSLHRTTLSARSKWTWQVQETKPGISSKENTIYKLLLNIKPIKTKEYFLVAYLKIL